MRKQQDRDIGADRLNRYVHRAISIQQRRCVTCSAVSGFYK